jgi:hypothetical protein
MRSHIHCCMILNRGNCWYLECNNTYQDIYYYCVVKHTCTIVLKRMLMLIRRNSVTLHAYTFVHWLLISRSDNQSLCLECFLKIGWWLMASIIMCSLACMLVWLFDWCYLLIFTCTLAHSNHETHYSHLSHGFEMVCDHVRPCIMTEPDTIVHRDDEGHTLTSPSPDVWMVQYTIGLLKTISCLQCQVKHLGLNCIRN